MKLIEENIGETLPNQGTGKDFLNRNPTAEGAIPRLDKGVYRKLRKIPHSKGSICSSEESVYMSSNLHVKYGINTQGLKRTAGCGQQNPHHPVSFLMLKVKVEFSKNLIFCGFFTVYFGLLVKTGLATS